MRELKNIEDKILDRALYLIGINRSCDISIRAIAKEANVNVSAINYYFRTKDEMLRQAKELYIANIHSIISILGNEEYNEEEKLILAVNEIMEYIIRFPGITVIFKDASAKVDETSKRILKVSEDMTNQINRILNNIIQENILISQYKSMIFWASINYPIENNELTEIDLDILKDRDSRIAYIKYLLKILKEKA